MIKLKFRAFKAIRKDVLFMYEYNTIYISIYGFYLFVSALVIICKCSDLYFFNPIRNYKKWKSLNFLGVGFFTILLHILFPHMAIIYWIYVLFTFGRKKENENE